MKHDTIIVKIYESNIYKNWINAKIPEEKIKV